MKIQRANNNKRCNSKANKKPCSNTDLLNLIAADPLSIEEMKTTRGAKGGKAKVVENGCWYDCIPRTH